MSRKIFDEAKYVKYYKLGMRGENLAKKLGYSSASSLSRGKKHYMSDASKKALMEAVDLVERIQTKQQAKTELIIKKENLEEETESEPEQVEAELIIKKETNAEAKVEDIISLLEDFSRKLIMSIDIYDIKAKDKLYAGSSYLKTMTNFIVEMAKLKGK